MDGAPPGGRGRRLGAPACGQGIRPGGGRCRARLHRSATECGQGRVDSLNFTLLCRWLPGRVAVTLKPRANRRVLAEPGGKCPGGLHPVVVSCYPPLRYSAQEWFISKNLVKRDECWDRAASDEARSCVF